MGRCRVGAWTEAVRVGEAANPGPPQEPTPPDPVPALTHSAKPGSTADTLMKAGLFVPSRTFTKAMYGFAFKTDQVGTAFYRDGKAGIGPTVLPIDYLLNDDVGVSDRY